MDGLEGSAVMRGQEPQTKDCKQLFFVQHRVNITLKLMGK